MLWPLRNKTYLHIQTSASTAGKRKKPLAGRSFPMQTYIADTAVLSRSRPPFFCFDDPCTVFWHGGFRREPLCNENYFDKFRQGLACQKKPSPGSGDKRLCVCTIPCRERTYCFLFRPVGLWPAGRILLFPAVCYPAQKEISKKWKKEAFSGQPERFHSLYWRKGREPPHPP